MRFCRSILIVAVVTLLLISCAPKEKTIADVPGLLIDAKRFLDEGNYEDAIYAFTTALELDPTQEEAYILLAEAHEKSGQSENARTTLRVGADRLTSSFSINDRLAKMEAASGNFQAAIRVYQSFLENNPTHEFAYQSAKELCLQQSEWNTLRELASQRFAAFPTDIDALKMLMSSELNLGNFDTVLELFESKHAELSGDQDALLLQLAALAGKGNIEEILRLLDEEPSLIENALYNEDDKGFYVGSYQNGKRNGYGIYYYSTSEKTQTAVYMGYWLDDLREGNGTAFSRSDVVLSGEWANDLPNGACIKSWSGARLSIVYEDGKPTSTANYTDSEGYQYQLSVNPNGLVPTMGINPENGNTILAKGEPFTVTIDGVDYIAEPSLELTPEEMAGETYTMLAYPTLD